MADEIIVRYKAEVDNLVKGLNEVKTEVNTLQKENDTLQKKLGKTFDEPVEKVKSLKTQLKELKSQLANATDPKEVERLARAAGELADRIGDASDAAKVFASESKFEQVGNAFGSVVSKVKSLDFKGALDQSKLLLATSKSITFKDAIGGLKEMGGTLKNIGQAILQNPLFLIAGAVYAAVQVFNDLEDASARVNQTYTDGLEILKQSREASEAYRKAARDIDIENEISAGKLTELEGNKIKNQNKYQDEYKKLLKERQQREKEAIEQAAKDREEDGFRRTKDLYESLGGETDATKAHKQKLKDIETAFNESVKELNALFREEDEKARITEDNKKLKEKQELAKKLIEEEQKLRKVLRDLQTQNITDGYEREKQALQNKFDDDVELYKNNGDITKELTRKLNWDLADLDTKYGKVKIDADGKLQEKLKLSMTESNNEIIDLTAANNLKLKQLNEQEAEDQAAKDKEALEKRIQNIQAFVNFAQQALSTYSQIYNDSVNAEIQATTDARDEKLEALQQEYDAKLISQEIYEARKKAITDEAAKKESELKKEQFEKNKQISIIQATISTAQAVAGAYTQVDKLGYGAFILAGLMAALGLAQISAIASQPTPKFEDGGWIGGKRHKDGGTIVEAEKDEFIINRKDAMKNADLLEAINEGVANDFINQNFVAPMLREQEKKFAEAKEKSFADNIANSMFYNSFQFKDSNLLESLKRSRQSDRENAIFIVRELSKNQHNKRSW